MTGRQSIRCAVERMLWRGVFMALAAVFLTVLLPVLWDLFSPFLIGLAVAALLRPLIALTQEKLHMRRGVAVGLWVALAVPVTALGASLYQTADLGIAPYDYLSLGLRDYTPVPYFGCRVFTDALCALLCWLLGGLVGIGTLICAFCLGPFIQFFNGLVSERVLHYKPGGQ